jgi:DNA-binding NarL/FixJ family response regulator
VDVTGEWSNAAASRGDDGASRDGPFRLIRAFVVGEVRIYREGLAELLARAGIDVAGTAVDLYSCRAAIAEKRPDIVLFDVAGSAGVSAIRRLVDDLPGTTIVAFGVSGSSDEVIACAEAGAKGYVTRDKGRDELIDVLESVAHGETLCSPEVAAALMDRVAALAMAAPKTSGERLTRREYEIVSLVEEGLSNKEIAQRLVIEVATVKSHVHNILEKLKLTRRSDAAAWVRGREKFRQSTL